METEELALHDLREHVRQPRLLNLESTDRLPEHHAIARVRERFLVARHRRPDRSPRDAVARLRQAHERTLDASRLR